MSLNKTGFFEPNVIPIAIGSTKTSFVTRHIHWSGLYRAVVPEDGVAAGKVTLILVAPVGAGSDVVVLFLNAGMPNITNNATITSANMMPRIIPTPVPSSVVTGTGLFTIVVIY